jgi:hypothetical protein
VKCKVEKPGTDFYIKKNKNKNGTYHSCLHSFCKKCYLAQCRLWGEKNIDKRRAYSRQSFRRRKFGIESIDYLRMLQEQEHRCAICGCEPKRRLDIDHCHASSEIRGLLCSNCNNGLGRFKDSPELLMKAAIYLAKKRKVAA